MIAIAKKINWLLSAQLGIDLRLLLRSLKGMPRYISDLRKFRRLYSGTLNLQPCFSDYSQEGGSTKSEYFWQDLLIAQKIFSANPETHVDIGSRIDSFVAHVASFRKIEVFDIRDVTSKIPNVTFKQADFMDTSFFQPGYCDSLSCLHALEHFGLGRYGDPLDALGYTRGLKNMAQILKEGGTFYLSVPVGIPRVEFNAHRVFDPKDLSAEANKLNLKLKNFIWIDQENVMHESEDIKTDMDYLLMQDYSLGIFIFNKTAQ